MARGRCRAGIAASAPAPRAVPWRIRMMDLPAPALKSRVKVIDTQAVRRWWKKIGKVRDEPWSAPQKLNVGTKLIECLVQGGGSWFEIAIQPAPGGKTECRILLSEMAVKAMEDLDQRASLAQPLRLPMICPPKRWAFTPKPQKEAA